MAGNMNRYITIIATDHPIEEYINKNNRLEIDEEGMQIIYSKELIAFMAEPMHVTGEKLIRFKKEYLQSITLSRE